MAAWRFRDIEKHLSTYFLPNISARRGRRCFHRRYVKLQRAEQRRWMENQEAADRQVQAMGAFRTVVYYHVYALGFFCSAMVLAL
jgi:hypothetical protein